LFELQAWLGHSTPHSTQHYARLSPTKLSRAYIDAQYFQRNLRTIDVLIDQDAVRRGLAAGEPWRFYDLGHGYCTYDFFDQCPHRMACAKCAFYRPKDSAKPLLVERENRPTAVEAGDSPHGGRGRGGRRWRRRIRHTPDAPRQCADPGRTHAPTTRGGRGVRTDDGEEGVMVTTWVDFKQLKADVAIEQVVAHYGVHLRRVGGTELRGRCPLPTHSSSRSRDSFAVNIARNVWSCRSLSCMQARGGRPGGNVRDFVALMERCSIREAALRLQQWSGAAPERFIVPREVRPDPVASEDRPLHFALQYVDATHPYLTSRGVSLRTARTFGLGFYTGRGLLRGRIVIPIHNEAGELVAYAGRAIDGQEPKYRFPAGFRKSLVLFNLHRAIATKAHTVILVEGFFDAIAVYQAGYPAVIALMGSTLSRTQADLLRSHFDRIILMLDGDAAGQQGTATIMNLLAPQMPVDVVSLQEREQPDQRTAREIQRVVQQSQAEAGDEHTVTLPKENG
jgi:5S rRNA maturation endonuclease (ribonuclease M5)